jgi:protease-4
MLARTLVGRTVRTSVLVAAMVLSAGAAAPVWAGADKANIAMIEIEGGLQERKAEAMGLFGGGKKKTGLRELVEAIDTAGGRSDVDGVLIKLKDPAINTAQIEEIGRAIERLRAKGKKAHLYAYGYETSELLLGSYCDEVIVQAGGGVMLPGLHMEEMYLADMLAWVGAKPDMVQVGDYKGASEQMMNAKPSPAWNQNIDQLLDSMYANVRGQLKKGRKLDDAGLDKAMESAWMALAEDAKKTGLVDSIVDLPELSNHLKQQYGKTITWETDLLPEKSGPKMDAANPFAMFAQLMSKPDRKPTRDTIAVVHIDGAIVDGDSGGGGLLGGGDSVGSLTIRRALGEIEENKHVKGVIVRIDSPGGSAIASEVIWQGLKRVSAKGKPVWISVGGMAASGGYYILSAGDKVYVNPSSIVGSIGVVGGKIALGGVMEKLHINVVERSRGPRAGMMSSNRPWTDAERAFVRAKMKETYDLFASRVSAGRKGIDLAQTAEGRLFTGEKAIALKMADKLGGLDQATDDLAKSLNLADGSFDVFDYPGPKSFEEMIEQMLGGVGVSAQVGGVSAVVDVSSAGEKLLGPARWRAVRDWMAAAGQMQREHVLLMSPQAIYIR